MAIAKTRRAHHLWLWLAVVAAIAVICALAARVAGADVIHLRSGGRIEGQVANPEQSPRVNYVIKTRFGQVTLARDEVREIVAQTSADEEYERIRPTYADTVESQWALAEWCREHGLKDQRTAHLRRVIELDTDHAAARGLLGYSRFDGEWKTQAEVMTERGYVFYKGSWKLPQEIEILESQHAQTKAERAWYGTLKRLRAALDTEKRQAALDDLRAINDPAAVPAVIKMLEDERLPGYRRLLVDILGRIHDVASNKELTLRALNDPSEDVRAACVEHVVAKPMAKSIATFVQNLRSADNSLVNRAGEALGRFRDPTTVAPLIEALVTTHTRTIVQGSGGMGGTFANDGSLGSFNAGRRETKINYVLQNPEVLDALVAISGGTTFNYDKNAWRVWYANQRAKTPVVDLRRDDPTAAVAPPAGGAAPFAANPAPQP